MKLYNKKKKPINFGDILTINVSYGESELGCLKFTSSIMVTENNYRMLQKAGYLIVEDDNNKEITLDNVYASLAQRLKISMEELHMRIDFLYEMYPSIAFSILLKEIAIMCDQKYEDTISNQEQYYIISLLDGRIHTVNRRQIKNFKNFAAFRTLEDAKSACKLLKSMLKQMFE